MKTHTLLIVYILLLHSCCQKTEKANRNIEKLSIEINKSQSIKFNEIIDTISMEFIKLETNSECIMGNVQKLRVEENKLYCVSNNKVFVFDKQGDFLFAIDNYGEGPKEYLSISDIFIDGKSNVYILDYMKRQIVKYSSTGSFIKNIKTGLIGQAFEKISEDIWAIYIGTNKSEVSSERLNLYSESQNKIIYSCIPISDNEYNWMYFEDINNFTTLPNGALQFNYTLNDTLYTLNSLKMEPYLMIDWNENALPESLSKRNYSDVMDFSSHVDDKYIYSFIGIFSNQNNLTFGFRSNQKMFLAIYDNKDKEVKIINEFVNPFGISNTRVSISLPLLAVASDSDFFYSVVDSYFIQSEIKEIKDKLHPLFELSMDDNPVIFKYRFK